MMALSPSERARLIGLLGMCGSAFDGERANAASLADRFLRDRKLSWADVVLPNAAPPVAPSPPPAPRAASWRETVARCRATPGSLRAWEIGFLAGLDRFPRLSAKQRTILQEIAVRLGVAEGRA
jgi:hypothetical protein